MGSGGGGLEGGGGKEASLISQWETWWKTGMGSSLGIMNSYCTCLDFEVFA